MASARYRLSIIAIAGMAGCLQEPSERVNVTDYGIPVIIHGNVGVDQKTVLHWVDLRAHEWIANKKSWDLGMYTDVELITYARLEPVHVYPGRILPNGKLGWNQFGRRIDAAIFIPPDIFCCPYDPPRGPVFDENGNPVALVVLPHEWKHTILGNWHPETQ